MNDSTKNKVNYISKFIIIISGILGIASIIIEYGFYLPAKYSNILHYIAIG